ncbi:MAG: TPMT family class I SAM-dependent methyltransferase [bacterium]|nr:TPMT family class I SAM-dependent methyltransferase [bacterium]
MVEQLSKEFWASRYQSGTTGWDLGEVSPPIKAYIDQLTDKTVKILIPGCGNGYEAEYLWNQGFENVHVIDLAKEPLDNLKRRCPGIPKEQLHQGDFFDHSGDYDLIFEQTMFCAIDPALRQKYADKVHELLGPSGKLVGVLFSRDFDGGPPFGGSKEEYLKYFSAFKDVKMEPCYNSVEPRQGSELFVSLVRSDK